MRNLIVEYWHSPNEERNCEVRNCIIENIDSGLFDRIHIFVEDSDHVSLFPNSELLKVHSCDRMNYGKLIDFSNTVTAPEDINVLANSDIAFDRAAATQGFAGDHGHAIDRTQVKGGSAGQVNACTDSAEISGGRYFDGSSLDERATVPIVAGAGKS